MPANHTLHLQGFCYRERESILPALTLACTDSGAWIVGRKNTEQDVFEFGIELQRHNIVNLYASLLASGIDLTRAAHSLLTSLCSCQHHLAPDEQIVSLKLELNFLEDVTLRSLLMTPSEVA
jgi:hypothetical protein